MIVKFRANESGECESHCESQSEFYFQHMEKAAKQSSRTLFGILFSENYYNLALKIHS